MLLRCLNLAVGMWLVVSAFAWGHSSGQMANAIVCGALVVTLAVVGFFRRQAWSAEGAVALWLFFSSILTLNLGEFTLAHNVVCAAILMATALPSEHLRHFTGPAHPIDAGAA